MEELVSPGNEEPWGEEGEEEGGGGGLTREGGALGRREERGGTKLPGEGDKGSH